MMGKRLREYSKQFEPERIVVHRIKDEADIECDRCGDSMLETGPGHKFVLYGIEPDSVFHEYIDCGLLMVRKVMES